MSVINKITSKLIESKVFIIILIALLIMSTQIVFSHTFESLVLVFKKNSYLDYFVKYGANWAMVAVTLCTVIYLKWTFEQQRREIRENDFKSNFYYLLDSYKKSKENLKLYRVSDPQPNGLRIHYDRMICSGDEVFRAASKDIVKGNKFTDTCYEGYISGISSYVNSLNTLVIYYENYGIQNKFLKDNLLLTIRDSITSEESLYLMSVINYSETFTILKKSLQNYCVFSLNKISLENIVIMIETMFNPPTIEQRNQVFMIFDLFSKEELPGNFKELLIRDMISEEEFTRLAFLFKIYE